MKCGSGQQNVESIDVLTENDKLFGPSSFVDVLTTGVTSNLSPTFSDCLVLVWKCPGLQMRKTRELNSGNLDSGCVCVDAKRQ